MNVDEPDTIVVNQDKQSELKAAYHAIVDQQCELYAALRVMRDTAPQAMEEVDLLKFLSKHAYDEFEEYAEKVELFSKMAGVGY